MRQKTAKALRQHAQQESLFVPARYVDSLGRPIIRHASGVLLNQAERPRFTLRCHPATARARYQRLKRRWA